MLTSPNFWFRWRLFASSLECQKQAKKASKKNQRKPVTRHRAENEGGGASGSGSRENKEKLKQSIVAYLKEKSPAKDEEEEEEEEEKEEDDDEEDDEESMETVLSRMTAPRKTPPNDAKPESRDSAER